MVATAIAVKACRGFERVDHEPVASTAAQDRCLVGAGTAWWDIGHLTGYQF